MGKFRHFRNSWRKPDTPVLKLNYLLLSDFHSACDDLDRLRFTLFEKSEHLPSTALKQQLIQIENLMKFLGETLESLHELVSEEYPDHPSQPIA